MALQNFIEEGLRRGLEILLAGQIRWAVYGGIAVAPGVTLLFAGQHGRLDTWNRASRQCGEWQSWPVGSTRPSGSSRRL